MSLRDKAPRIRGSSGNPRSSFAILARVYEVCCAFQDQGLGDTKFNYTRVAKALGLTIFRVKEVIVDLIPDHPVQKAPTYRLLTEKIKQVLGITQPRNAIFLGDNGLAHYFTHSQFRKLYNINPVAVIGYGKPLGLTYPKNCEYIKFCKTEYYLQNKLKELPSPIDIVFVFEDNPKYMLPVQSTISWVSHFNSFKVLANYTSIPYSANERTFMLFANFSASLSQVFPVLDKIVTY